jgi:hypothetical protein
MPIRVTLIMAPKNSAGNTWAFESWALVGEHSGFIGRWRLTGGTMRGLS